MDKEVKEHSNIDGEGETESDIDQKGPGNGDDRAENSLTRTRQVQYKKLPLLIWLLEKSGLLNFKPLLSHKALILMLTYVCYSSYYLSRKPFSVVKVVFCPVCANCNVTNGSKSGWAPFNVPDGNSLLGVMDYSWLFAYAITMFISGQIADRVNLRYFLTVGMLGSGVSVALLGAAYFARIHELWYFIVAQVFSGIMQSTGWPGVVAVMSHWFGKHNRGLIMGVWTSHYSVGSILGTVIPAFWADCDGEEGAWGWSFLLPAFVIFCIGIVMFLMLVVNPKHVDLPPPRHNIEEPEEATPRDHQSNGMYNGLTPGEVSDMDDKGKVAEERRTEIVTDLVRSSVQSSAVGESNAKPKSKTVNILRAFLIPGVIEFSLALFFNKLVSFTFLYWLPFYIKYTLTYLTGPQSGWLSTLYDVGGIIGVILAGVVSDQLRARAIVCVVMLILAIPSLFVLDTYAGESFGLFIVMLILTGMFVNGPYAMITTAVSSDLGTHKSLKSNQNAKATVAAIINGTGSLGAAFGPLIVGLVTTRWNWMAAFYLLMLACALSALLLTRLVIKDIRKIYRRFKNKYSCSHVCFRGDPCQVKNQTLN